MFVLDTNVVSEFRKLKSGKAHPKVAAWAHATSPALMFLSVVTLHELEQGILQVERTDVAQGQLLRTWLERGVLPGFEGRLLDVTPRVARWAASYHVPNPAPFRDGLIAATAATLGMTVATRNFRDFGRFGTPLINPWA